MSDLEDQLRELKLREVPQSWRADILDRCRAEHRTAEGDHSVGLKEWLWPSPLAWAALAVIWVGLAVLHEVSAADRSAVDTAATSRSASPVLLARRDYQSLFAQLR